MLLATVLWLNTTYLHIKTNQSMQNIAYHYVAKTFERNRTGTFFAFKCLIYKKAQNISEMFKWLQLCKAMCIAFYTHFLNIPRSVWTQRIVGILARWGSIDASLKFCGILKNKGCEKGANFRLSSTLEQCLSAFYDVASLKGQPLSMCRFV